jgi:hypothetical protein
LKLKMTAALARLISPKERLPKVWPKAQTTPATTEPQNHRGWAQRASRESTRNSSSASIPRAMKGKKERLLF